MIAFNGRFLGARVTGVQRFARELLTAGAGDWGEARILAPQKIAKKTPDFAGLDVQGVGALSGVPWEQIDLPLACGDDFLVNLCCVAPVVRARQLYVLHDVAFARYPSNYTFAFRSWYHVMTRMALARSARIATVSQASASEIASYFGLPLSRIEIVSESGEHILRTPPQNAILARLGLTTDHFVLAVSSFAPNKNFDGLVKALELRGASDMPVVIVGARDARIYQGQDKPLTGVIEAGYVSDGELRALYENAACFVFPSLYEGFGLPPLEAMSCGCPVLTSQVSSMPEVCGAAALYCDPFSPEDIADKLALVTSDPYRRAEMRLAGLERARVFSWAKGAAALRQILGSI